MGTVAGGLSGARTFNALSHRGHVVFTKLFGRPLINGPTTAFISRPQEQSWLLGGPSALPLSGVQPAAGLRTAVSGGTHRVRPGESLWEIAQQVYGDGRLWPVLLRDNRGAIANPNLIFVGQNVQVPALPAEELRRLLMRVQHVVQ